ncbi:hypothetical protein [Burkholderia sp. BCC1977]|uniref:hypothetical protein n=1 Tax=Burkholderia sp. BCC1977 TaxID=2817440 RepID=UPI002ABDC894|nr:hypothetical protein [Burkholderia sp. BCC1977]
MRELTQQEIQATSGGTGLLGALLTDIASLLGLGSSQHTASASVSASCGTTTTASTNGTTVS